jgi:hypothetical protein
MVIHNNLANRNLNKIIKVHSLIIFFDASFKFLPYQLSMVGYWPTMAITGNGESGFDSGEGA